MPSDLARRIFDHVARQRMLLAGDHVGVGVSGGADSVALLRLLEELCSELGIRLTVLHFNHHLRGAESDADEQFVAALAAERGLPILVGRENVAAVARARGWNLEDAGRRLRYAYFSSLLRAGGITRVAVAHTADDQAETVMARLVRGTGPAGLAAIYPIIGPVVGSADGLGKGHTFRGPLVRPLLDIRRRELCAYLDGWRQTWREDSSNQDTRRLRARLRHQILPLFEGEVQPSIVANLGRLAQMAREDEAFWTTLVAQRLGAILRRQDGRLGIRCADLLAPLPWMGSDLSEEARSAVARRLVRGLVEELRGDCRDLMAQHIEQVLRLAARGASGQRSDLPGVMAERSFEWLWFSATAGLAVHGSPDMQKSPDPRAAAEEYFHAIELGSSREATVVVPEIGRRFRLKVIDWPCMQRDTNKGCTFDRDLLRSPLVLRNWRVGDSFRPSGRRSEHKLKHLLRDRRVGARERAGWPVLTSAGDLIWARGLPVAAKVAPWEQTRTGVVIVEEEI